MNYLNNANNNVLFLIKNSKSLNTFFLGLITFIFLGLALIVLKTDQGVIKMPFYYILGLVFIESFLAVLGYLLGNLFFKALFLITTAFLIFLISVFTGSKIGFLILFLAYTLYFVLNSKLKNANYF